MSTKAFPKYQGALRLQNGRKNVLLTIFEINDTTSTYVVLPDSALDVQELRSSRHDKGATENFYLSGTGDTVVNFDGGSAGAEHWIVSRHADLGYVTEA